LWHWPPSQKHIRSATRVWLESGKQAAANGGIMRTSIVGALNYKDLSKAVSDAFKLCKITHVDPRCTSGCVAVSVAIARMIQFAACNKGALIPEQVIDEAFQVAEHCLEDEKHKKELHEVMYAKNLQVLKLDEGNAIGYTNKTLGAAFVCLRKVLQKKTTFEDVIYELIMEAGDADTNAAVAGALVGAAVGFSALPQNRIQQLLHLSWLENKLNRFISTMIK
jgi:ADP-ribosylglycohydrolase